MRIIKISKLRQFWIEHRRAEKEIRTWIRITQGARWRTPADVKRQFGARVDFIKVASGNAIAVFDIANNNYRMIVAIHYDYPRVFVMRILDHQEYDQQNWKDEL